MGMEGIYGPLTPPEWAGLLVHLTVFSDYLLKTDMQTFGEKGTKITWFYLFLGGYVTISHPTKFLGR